MLDVENDFNLMEEILLEYSVCYYYDSGELTFQLSDETKINKQWVKIRDIPNAKFNVLESTYVKLATLLDRKPRRYDAPFMCLDPEENPDYEIVQEKIIEMSEDPSNIKSWPTLYEDLSGDTSRSEELLNEISRVKGKSASLGVG